MLPEGAVKVGATPAMTEETVQYSKDEVDRIIFRCKKIWQAKAVLPYPNPEKPESNRSRTKKVQIF
jgi:hypothetical protein